MLIFILKHDCREEWIILSPDTTLYESDRIAELQPGHLYFTRVMAINGAGLISVHDTDGFLIDPTPPQVGLWYNGI